MGRCVLALGTLGVDLPVAGTLGRGRKCVEVHLPPRGPRARPEAAKYRDIVLKDDRPYKFATESIVAGRGFTEDRTPPYGKRLSGADLCWSSVKNFDRFASSTEREKRKGRIGIVPGQLDRTAQRGIQDTCRTHDCVLSAADRDHDNISRVD